MRRMHTLNAVRDFLLFERMARGLAETSAKLYGCILGRFVRAVGENSTLDAAGGRAEEFLINEGRRGLGDHARKKTFDVVRLFFRWAAERGLVRGNPLRDARAPRVHARPRSFLSRPEVDRLLLAVKTSGRLHARRDHAILSVMFFAGLRVSEALRLRIHEVDLVGGIINVLGKGGKVRRVPIHPTLAATLREWIKDRGSDSVMLFPSRAAGNSRTGALDNSRIELVLREHYAPRAGLAGRATPHTLRRSFATELRRRGVPLEHVQRLLGHADIRTTMMYLAEVPEGLAKSVRRL